RILTVHAAKGLEFPIVFLAGLGVAPVFSAPVFGHRRDDQRIAVTIGAKSNGAQFKLGPVDDVEKHEKLHAEAERARLLYVAATRARDHLVVSLFHQERTKDCSAIRLIQAGAQELAEPMQPVAIASTSAARPFDGLEVELQGWDEATFEAGRAALVAAAHTQHNTSATALGRSDEPKDQPEDET